MSKLDVFTLRSIAREFGGEARVHCRAGIADIVTDDEVIETGAINDWQVIMDQAKSLAKCLNRQPSIMLTGMTSVEEVDAIDDACEAQGASLYLYDGMTLTNIAEYWLLTSRDKAIRVADTIAARYKIGARSNELINYQKEMFEVLAEIELGPDPITKLLEY